MLASTTPTCESVVLKIMPAPAQEMIVPDRFRSTGVIATNGVLTTDTFEQAIDRAGGKVGNKGADAALAALELVSLRAVLGS